MTSGSRIKRNTGGKSLAAFRSLSPGVRLSLAVLNRRLSGLPPGSPENLILDLTRRCQLGCSHCRFLQSPPAAPAADMPYGLALRLLRGTAAKGLPRVSFFGGEPTLYPRLPELIAEASQLGLFTELNTNGLRLLDGDFLRSLAGAGLCAAQISLHSASERAHDSLAGPGTFAKARQALAVSLRAGLLVYVSACVFAEELRSGGTEELAAFARTEGAHGIRFLPYSRAGRRTDLPLLLSRRLARLAPDGFARSCVKSGAGKCAAADGSLLYVGADGVFRSCPYAYRPLPSAAGELFPRPARRRPGFHCQFPGLSGK